MNIKRKPSYTELLLIMIPVIAIVYAGFWGAYQFVSPAPPRNITISAGNIHGSYYAYAEKYKDQLALDGITLTVLESKGSRENINRLLNKEADAALVQGGTAYADEKLISLGSLYYEPVSIFYKKDLQLNRLNDFTGLRISIGVDGSGTHMLASQLFAINHVNSQNTQFLYLNPQDSLNKLKTGELDAVFFVSSINSPVIQALLHNKDFTLFNFDRADAYSQVLPFLSKVTLHQGIIDFKNNIPQKAITLLAPTANLVVHDDIHKSLSILLLQAIEANHGNNDLFSPPGFFPSDQLTAFPVSDVAERFLEVGPPFLIKYLPFWIATFIDRMIVLTLPLLLLIVPLFKILPPVYRWRIRSKVYRWYEQLQKVDDQTRVSQLSDEEYQYLTEELDRITDEVSKLHTPLSNADQLYNLLVHIDLIKKTIQSKQQNDK
ncbi:MAG: ABC transporter substrate-binding protein [gamma proteobacterium symbiont of Bathyaustriella thionipta]|nr:ABC transporter substrate-binding protein [gamma proteobacterium symbiont of Bathyaustriella thionipta]MCU7950714.1 ABC transporter substrate-binding protein [gamma proteobacterium symbiont of Bathyaustriella thionipta]MCU7953663.1 ABC transporter substrate-binding protein [gamma proteobacterium symbiont of Bathyaustriella thionipta]MCU7957209.1 ABC transporter substrate-binding protein [gamma proteobacterium symbiont of Bathyaustriella thionipta]MCU7967168.1 ABC transporter substrate-bindin